jgi:hypothetical protein
LPVAHAAWSPSFGDAGGDGNAALLFGAGNAGQCALAPAWVGTDIPPSSTGETARIMFCGVRASTADAVGSVSGPSAR